MNMKIKPDTQDLIARIVNNLEAINSLLYIQPDTHIQPDTSILGDDDILVNVRQVKVARGNCSDITLWRHIKIGTLD